MSAEDELRRIRRGMQGGAWGCLLSFLVVASVFVVGIGGIIYGIWWFVQNTEAETVSEKNGQDLASDDLLDVAKNYDNTEEHDSKDYLGDAVSQTPAFPVTRKSGGMDNIASVKGVDHHGGNHLNRDASASIPFRYAKRLKRRIEALISFHCAGTHSIDASARQ